MSSSAAAQKKRPRGADEPAAPGGGGASSSTSSSSSAAAAPSASLRKQVETVLEANPGGMTQKQLLRALPEHTSTNDVLAVLQTLTNEQRVECLQSRAPGAAASAPPQIVFRLLAPEMAAKLQGLSAEETAVLALIEKTANVGLWVRNIKLSTKLQLTALNKILKKLEKHKLIKPVKSIAFKNRRMYMAFHLEPAKEVTGGIWYSEQALDDDFIASMREAVMSIVEGLGGVATPTSVCASIKERNITSVPLTPTDVAQLMDTLVADGRLDTEGSAKRRATVYARSAAATYKPRYGGGKSASAAAAAQVAAGGDRYDEDDDADDDEEDEDDDDEGGGADAGVVGRRYHAVQPGLTVDALTAMPCGACPVTAQCEPGGVISPETCVYFTKWLEF